MGPGGPTILGFYGEIPKDGKSGNLEPPHEKPCHVIGKYESWGPRNVISRKRVWILKSYRSTWMSNVLFGAWIYDFVTSLVIGKSHFKRILTRISGIHLNSGFQPWTGEMVCICPDIRASHHPMQCATNGLGGDLPGSRAPKGLHGRILPHHQVQDFIIITSYSFSNNPMGSVGKWHRILQVAILLEIHPCCTEPWWEKRGACLIKKISLSHLVSRTIYLP